MCRHGAVSSTQIALGTALVQSGVDIRTVQALLGHPDLQTTARHLHSDTRTEQVAASKLARS